MLPRAVVVVAVAADTLHCYCTRLSHASFMASVANDVVNVPAICHLASKFMQQIYGSAATWHNCAASVAWGTGLKRKENSAGLSFADG